MTLTEVTYNSNAGYEVVYACHDCGKVIPGNRFKYCPFCGVGLVRDGRPEGRLDLDEGDICGLIAIAITNGGFGKSRKVVRNDGFIQFF